MSKQTRFRVEFKDSASYAHSSVSTSKRVKEYTDCGVIIIVAVIFFVAASAITTTILENAGSSLNTNHSIATPGTSFSLNSNLSYDPSCIADQNSEYTLVYILTDNDGNNEDQYTQKCPGAGAVTRLKVFTKSNLEHRTIRVRQPGGLATNRIYSAFFNSNNQIVIVQSYEYPGGGPHVTLSRYSTDGDSINSIELTASYYFKIFDQNDKCIAIWNDFHDVWVINTSSLSLITTVSIPISDEDISDATFTDSTLKIEIKNQWDGSKRYRDHTVPSCF